MGSDVSGKPSGASGWASNHAWTVTLLVLLASVIVSLLVWHQLREQAREQASREFSLLNSRTVDQIESRMNDYKQVLRAGAALLESRDEISRETWRRFIERLALPEHYPGFQGVGVSLLIDPDALTEHEATVRAEGFPDYQVHPEGERARYTSIVYLEPFSGRNLAAFGYDMYSDPVRGTAMDLAVSKNVAVLSNAVTLLQESDTSVQSGVLMYLPSYYPGMPLSSVSARWRALRGFVYSPFRMGDLIAGTLGERDELVHFEIYDGLVTTDATRIYRSWQGSRPKHPEALQETLVLPLHQQVWTIRFYSTPAFSRTFLQSRGTLALLVGLTLSLLLTTVIYTLATRRQRAEMLAEKMTQDLRHTEQALRINQERHQLAMDSSSMGTWSWDLSANLITWDALLAPLFGLRSGESFDGTPGAFMMLLHPGDRERVRQELNSAAELRHEYDTEYRVIWPDGTLRHIASRARVLEMPDSNDLMMTGTCWDVTEKRRAQVMKREFVSTISHELRTPLTAISGAMGLLLGGALGTLPDAVQNLIRIANENSKRLLHLINDLLDFEKLDAGKLEFHFEHLDAQALLVNAIEVNESVAARHQASMVLRWHPANPVWLDVDAMRFQQIMANLISNAAKYSPPGGLITVSADISSGRLIIAVADQGKGIPDAFQDRVFERFAQADSSDTRRAGGTGLGLAICRELVSHMGGSIRFDSNDQGTTFYIDLPVVTDAPPTDTAQA
ncbi:MAG: CHASE domain-containing protein [Alcanivorax sp.]|nr:CHASE domain-containing protein [Alcanivorax sp.]